MSEIPDSQMTDRSNEVSLPQLASSVRLEGLSEYSLDRDGTPFEARTSADPPTSPGAEVTIQQAELMAVKVDNARHEYQNDPELCEKLIGEEIAKHSAPSGWCLLSTKAPSKAGGYIQLSTKGANKFATLQEILLWAGGRRRPGQGSVGPALEISHLCDNPRCLIRDHVVLETAVVNNSRKNCGRLIRCAHDGCQKFYQACDHQPRCVAYVDNSGYDTWEDLVAGGMH